MNKYTAKYKELLEEEQKALQKKTNNSEVEVIIDGSKTTLVQPQQIVSYNNDMRTPSFEKQMLDFVKRQEEFNKEVLKRLDVIEDKLERNNIK